MTRFALLLSLLLPLAACQQAAPPSSDGTAAPAAAEPASATPSAEAEAAAALSREGAPAAETPAEAAGAGPAERADHAPAPTDHAAPATDDLVAGTDYVVIQGGQPYQPAAGKIEVAEAFNFICPACAAFEPLFSAWKARQPADVRVAYVPADFGPQWKPYAQAYLVAEAMGLDAKTHGAVFNAIHVNRTLPGEGQKPDEAKIAAFYAQHGANPKQFVDAMRSFATDAKLNRARQFMLASGVDATPTLVVAGKYRVTTRKSFDDMLRVADLLIARERAAAGR